VYGSIQLSNAGAKLKLTSRPVQNYGGKKSEFPSKQKYARLSYNMGLEWGVWGTEFRRTKFQCPICLYSTKITNSTGSYSRTFPRSSPKLMKPPRHPNRHKKTLLWSKDFQT